jgi:hypothetical protein
LTAGKKLIKKELEKLDNPKMKLEILKRLNKIEETDERDFYF